MVDEEEKEDTGLTTGQKVAIGAAALIGIGLVAYGIYYLSKQAAAPPGPPGPAAGKGNVEITVLNGTTSPPAPIYQAALNLVNLATGNQFVDITDHNGKHTYRDMDPGTYKLYAVAAIGGVTYRHEQTIIVIADAILPVNVKLGVSAPPAGKFDCDLYVNIYNQSKIPVPYNDTDLNAGEGDYGETVTGLHLQLHLLKYNIATGSWVKIVDAAVPRGGYLSFTSLEVNERYELLLYVADATNTPVVKGQPGFDAVFCRFRFMPAVANSGTFARMTINIGKYKTGTTYTVPREVSPVPYLFDVPTEYEFRLDIDTTIYLQKVPTVDMRPSKIGTYVLLDKARMPSNTFAGTTRITSSLRFEMYETIAITGAVLASAGDAILTPRSKTDLHALISYWDTIPAATIDFPITPPAQFIMPSVSPPSQSVTDGTIILPIKHVYIDSRGAFDGVYHPLTLSHLTFNYVSVWRFMELARPG